MIGAIQANRVNPLGMSAVVENILVVIAGEVFNPRKAQGVKVVILSSFEGISHVLTSPARSRPVLTVGSECGASSLPFSGSCRFPRVSVA